MEQKINEWIFWHDKIATHVKIWKNGNEHRFQCCIGQEPYGSIFAMNNDTHSVRRVN
jgi:hypothetical protein